MKKDDENLKRGLRLMRSTLIVSKKKDVRDTISGRLLATKGFVSSKTGKITAKGKKAISLLK